MELNNIKFIVEISSRNFSFQDEVNNYLQKGWVLLSIYTTDHGEATIPHLRQHFILGASEEVDYSNELNELNKRNATKRNSKHLNFNSFLISQE